MRRVWLLNWLALTVACSDANVDSAVPASSGDSIPARLELVPAEWTVAEDTSDAGEVTVVSLQLPAAKDISGLGSDDEAPRLVLRCLGGRVEAFIDTVSPATDGITDPSPEPVRIQLDSAPACE